MGGMTKRERVSPEPSPGRIIALRRGELQMTQAQLAERAGVGERTIRNLESGKHIPQPIKLHAIATALEMEPAELRRILSSGNGEAA